MFDRYEFTAWLLLKYPIKKSENQEKIFEIIRKYCTDKTVNANIEQEKNASSSSDNVVLELEKNKSDVAKKILANDDANKTLTNQGKILEEIVLNNAKLSEKISEEDKNKINKLLINNSSKIKFSKREKTLKNIVMFHIFNNKEKYGKFDKIPNDLRENLFDFIREMEERPNLNSINFNFLLHLIDFSLDCYYGYYANEIFRKDRKDRTFLHLTARVGYVAGFKICLNAFGPEALNSVDHYGRTPLQYMILSNSISMARFFFPQGVTKEHIPLLFYAVKMGAIKTVTQMLLTKVSKESLVDIDGNNLLHGAVLLANLKMIEIVIKFDKNLINKPNKIGKTPIDIVIGMTRVVYDATPESFGEAKKMLNNLAAIMDLMILNGGETNLKNSVIYQENFENEKVNTKAFPNLHRKMWQIKRRKGYQNFLSTGGVLIIAAAVLLFVIGINRGYFYILATIGLGLGIAAIALAVLDMKEIIRLDTLVSNLFTEFLHWVKHLSFRVSPGQSLDKDIEMGELQQTAEAEKLLPKADTYQALLSLENKSDHSVKSAIKVSQACNEIFNYLDELNSAFMENMSSKSSEIKLQTKFFIELTNTQLEKLDRTESVFMVCHNMFVAFDNYLNRLSPKVTPEVDEFKQFLLATKKDLQKLIEKHFPNENQTSIDKKLLSFEDSVNDENDSSLSMNWRT